MSNQSEWKCLNLKCQGVLFKVGLLDEEGHIAQDTETKLELQSENGDHFYTCPHCFAKNVVISTEHKGLHALKLSRIKD